MAIFFNQKLAILEHRIWLWNVCPTVRMIPLCFVVLNQVDTLSFYLANQ